MLRSTALAFALCLAASSALADAPDTDAVGHHRPAPVAVPDARDQKIADLQKQLTESNQKGAYWMALAAALQKQRNAALDADVPLIAFPQQPQGPRQ